MNDFDHVVATGQELSSDAMGNTWAFDENASNNHSRLVDLNCVHNDIATWSFSVETQSVQYEISLKSAV